MAKKTSSTSGKGQSSPQKKGARSVTPTLADDAVHSLLHEIDPAGHVHSEDPSGKVRYDCNAENSVALSSTGKMLMTTPYVACHPDHCLVSYYRVQVGQGLHQDAAGNWQFVEVPVPNVPHQELFPDNPVATIDYNDPDLLEKVFQALAGLGVKIPRSLGSKIKRKQQELTRSAQRPSKHSPSKRKRV